MVEEEEEDDKEDEDFFFLSPPEELTFALVLELVEDLAEVCFADDTLLVPLFDDVEPRVLWGGIMERYAHAQGNKIRGITTDLDLGWRKGYCV